MLKLTLNTKFVPGSNISSDMACADWRFLLPSLDLEEVLCLVAPPVNVVSALSTICRRLNVVSTDPKAIEELKELARQRGLSKLRAIVIKSLTQLPFAERSMDLIWIARGGSLNPVRLPGVAGELERLLRPEGTVYFETFGPRDRLAALRRFRRSAGGNLDTRQEYWLTPHSGEVRTAVRVGDPAVARHFFRHVLFGLSFRTRLLSRVGEMLTALGLLRPVAWRRGILLDRSRRSGTVYGPPHYLVSLAHKAGIDLRGYRFGLAARGFYNSNKVISYLFEGSKQRPAIIVKMTRAREFNFRLANEAAVLTRLRQTGLVEPGTYPELLFFDTYHGQAALAQRVIPGEPFRRRTRLTVDCPFARDAISWIFRLGKVSANSAAATAPEVAAALQKLLAQFEEIYEPSAEESCFLRMQIERIRSSSSTFPLVFQHGDPGTWNLLVRPDGRVAFLDWESGEPNGMPLWDLFYFLLSFGSWISRQRGDRDVEMSFRKTFLAASPVSELLAGATERYCAEVGIAKDLVEPLFYTCWMHRALKEATRLMAANLQDGDFVRLLRLCIRERDRLSRLGAFCAESRAEVRSQGDLAQRENIRDTNGRDSVRPGSREPESVYPTSGRSLLW